MSKIVTYRPMCKIDIRHAYYLHPIQAAADAWIGAEGRLNSLTTAMQEALSAENAATNRFTVGKDLEIIALPDTTRLMHRHKIVPRLVNDAWELWIRAQDIGAQQYRPFIPIEVPFKLTFAILLKNRSFVHFTQSDETDGNGKIWYFSNTSGNRFGNTNYLNTSPSALSPPQNYASSLDRVDYANNAINLDVSGLQLTGIRFRLENFSYREDFRFQPDEGQTHVSVCRIQPIQMPTGLYTLRAFRNNNMEITSLKRRIFWNRDASPIQPFAIIELFHQPENMSADFLLTDNEQRLLSPTYTLWWQSRSLYWRYIFDSDQPAPDVANPLCGVKPETPENLRQFISKDRLPFSQRYRHMRFCVANGNNPEEILLPNPQPDRIYAENGEYFAEVYMGKTDYNKLIPNIT
jgi:hypothetical protein